MKEYPAKLKKAVCRFLSCPRFLLLVVGTAAAGTITRTQLHTATYQAQSHLTSSAPGPRPTVCPIRRRIHPCR